MFGFRSKNAKPDPAPFEVPGQSGFGFGPFHIVYDRRPMPDPGAPAVAYLTELLPIEQRSGPNFENQRQMQTIRRPGEMVVAVQGFGLQVIGQPGIPAGYFALQPLTNISSAPGALPLAGNPAIGQYELPTGGFN